MQAHRLVRENGLVHARAAEDARRASATRMVVASVSLTKKSPYGGALEGACGKEGGEAGYEPQDVTHGRDSFPCNLIHAQKGARC